MTKRVSVTLHDDEETILGVFADPDTAEHQALCHWAEQRGLNVEPSASEARFLRLLLQAGAAALREEALDEGYASLAESMTSTNQDEVKAMRRRYAKRTDRQIRG